LVAWENFRMVAKLVVVVKLLDEIFLGRHLEMAREIENLNEFFYRDQSQFGRMFVQCFDIFAAILWFSLHDLRRKVAHNYRIFISRVNSAPFTNSNWNSLSIVAHFYDKHSSGHNKVNSPSFQNDSVFCGFMKCKKNFRKISFGNCLLDIVFIADIDNWQLFCWDSGAKVQMK
jgi:hypothetical protein